MPYSIVRNDITKMRVDAIVNPTDLVFSGSGGTDEKVHRAAGIELDRACEPLPLLKEGMVAVTDGFNLPCRYIIHTNGPVWIDGTCHEREKLISCYRNALSAAEERHCESIAFPLISSGTFGYPKDQVLRIALETVTEYLILHDMTVYIVVYDKESYAISRKLQTSIESYIDENYIAETESSAPSFSFHSQEDAWDEGWDRIEAPAPVYGQENTRDEYADHIEATFMPYGSVMHAEASKQVPPKPAAQKQNAVSSKKKASVSLEDMLSSMDESFSGALFRLIDEKGMTDAQCYKKANIDKKLFSKIRNPKYHPSKPTILALAIALELNLEETKKLLEKAGLALSNSSCFDVIVQYFIVNGQYNLMEINEVLYQYDQNLLGNVIG